MCWVIFLPILASYMCIRAANSPSRSRKIAIYSSACGIGAFAPLVFVANYKTAPQDSHALTIGGIVGTILAIAGLALAVWTLLIRRRDRGVGTALPLVGLLVSVGGIACGVGAVLIGARVLIPADEKPWMWHCDQYAFDVTIPSERWQTKANPNVLGEFRSSRPAIYSIVAEARPAATDDEFRKVLGRGLEMRSTTPTTNTFEERGLNAFGNDCWIYMGDVKSAGTKDYFFGFSITRVRNLGIIMLVEGHYTMASQAGHAQEVESFRAQAKVFLRSAR